MRVFLIVCDCTSMGLGLTVPLLVGPAATHALWESPEGPDYSAEHRALFRVPEFWTRLAHGRLAADLIANYSECENHRPRALNGPRVLSTVVAA
jgi:hypothetical protein